ncbi:MAG TPA: hypothetical protein VNR42_02020 [Solirubrobacteraceae bacterium]|nr:hypothetical protein [Solirubrobacteraceae bacterium]
MTAYTGIWVVAGISAVLVLIGGEPVKAVTRRLLAVSLDPNPAPSVGHVLVLAAHNLPILAWPLLLGVAGAHRHRLARRVADTLLAGALAVNTLLVGIAIGAYGTPLLAYLPQVPFEWAAAAAGASGWISQRRHALDPREGLALFALTAGFVGCAAVLETVAIPHR